MRIHGDSRGRGTSRWLQPSSSPRDFPGQGHHCGGRHVTFPDEVSTAGVDMTFPDEVSTAGVEVTSPGEVGPAGVEVTSPAPGEVGTAGVDGTSRARLAPRV